MIEDNNVQEIFSINWLLWLSTMAPLTLSAGPGNLMVATSGAQSGVRRSVQFIIGLDITYFLLAVLVGGLAVSLLQALTHWVGVAANPATPEEWAERCRSLLAALATIALMRLLSLSR